MANRVIVECWDSESSEGEIIVDYDNEAESIGIVVRMLDATQRIAFPKVDFVLALKQLMVK